MKNKLNYLALLLILPVALVFTACGGQLGTEAKVNIGRESDYEESSVDDLNAYLVENVYKEEVEEDAMNSLFRVTVDMNGDLGKMGNMNVNINAIVGNVKKEGDATTAEDTYDHVLAAKMKATSKMTFNGKTQKSNENSEFYIKDGFMYVNFSSNENGEKTSGKIRYNVEDQGFNEYAEYLQFADINPVDLISQLNGMLNTTTIVTINTKGGYVRYCIDNSTQVTTEKMASFVSVEGEFDYDSDFDFDTDLPDLGEISAPSKIYLVFKDNTLIQIQMETQIDMFGIKMDMTLKMETNAGEIEFPNFKDYVDQSATK